MRDRKMVKNDVEVAVHRSHVVDRDRAGFTEQRGGWTAREVL